MPSGENAIAGVIGFQPNRVAQFAPVVHTPPTAPTAHSGTPSKPSLWSRLFAKKRSESAQPALTTSTAQASETQTVHLAPWYHANLSELCEMVEEADSTTPEGLFHFAHDIEDVVVDASIARNHHAPTTMLIEISTNPRYPNSVTAAARASLARQHVIAVAETRRGECRARQEQAARSQALSSRAAEAAK